MMWSFSVFSRTNRTSKVICLNLLWPHAYRLSVRITVGLGTLILSSYYFDFLHCSYHNSILRLIRFVFVRSRKSVFRTCIPGTLFSVLAAFSIDRVILLIHIDEQRGSQQAFAENEQWWIHDDRFFEPNVLRNLTSLWNQYLGDCFRSYNNF